ncbi:stalk domain-containing protein [Paenibacillus periandrae]|uniref:stalk domain-containing protein n=1 Tax=Paenibacillus periandrae TaxID=1761741 RepID=UPI001F088C07|nr:stalk domain-containing protein [Paenibacillus periandrae]
MKKYIIGALIGSALTVSATAGAAAVKQYILTEISYPVVVNGKEFKDPAAPILNYEGSTYVPLAKLGDITGVNYKWNEAAKQVEIVTSSSGGGTTAAPSTNHEAVKATPGGNIQLTPDAVIEKPKGLVVENGETVFYAYDKDDKFKGRFTDSDSAGYVIAKIKKTELPPTLSEGWIGAGFLLKVYGDVGFDGKDYVIRTGPAVTKQEVFYRFPLPDGFSEKANGGEIITNGVRLKSQDNGFYFNIADLQKVGLLK